MKKSLRAGTKLLALLASAFLLFNVTACSSDDDDEDSPVSPSSEPSVVKDSGVITITAPEAAGAVTLVADSASATKLYEGTSVQGALEKIMADYASSTDSFTISVASGTYNEMLFYTGSATINIVGTGTAQYGTDVLITYSNSGNSDAMKELANSHGITSGYFRGSNRFDGKVNLVLKNITLQNSYSRTANDGSSTQAEALVFSSTGNLIAYNSSFLSHQDTLYLGQKGGRMWFYKDYISGDVDFIWGYMDVALFEECSIYCRGDEATKAYIFASRSMTDAEANKGIVLLHNNIEVATGVTMWYGRNSGDDTQATILNNTITGAGTLNSNLYQSAPKKYVLDVAGDLAIGYKDYNNTFNGTVVDTSNRLDLCGALGERVAKREYNGRYVILNRGYSETNEKYATSSTKWDISKYEEEFGATEDTSNTNIYVDPVYAKNIVGGGKVQLTPSSDEANLTYSYKSSDESLAKVDANGLVTTVAGADGTAVITVTASNGSTDTMSVKVIPVEIPATAVKVALADTSVAKYGVTTATVTFEPADTSNQEFTLVSDNESVQLFDTSTQKLASSTTVEAVDGKATVSVWVGGNVTDATLTAKSTVYNSATAGTAKVSTTEGAVTWGDTGAWRVATDIQSGKSGIYDGLVIDSLASNSSLISDNGKMSLKTNSSMQTRNVILYIPVEGASTVKITAAKNTLSGCDYYVGESKSNPFTLSEDETVASYTYDGSKTGIVLGSDITRGDVQKDSGSIVNDGKYLRVDVPKVTADVYIASIDVQKTGEFDAEAWTVASPELSIDTNFAESSKTLDLNSSELTVTQTITASASDSTTPVITYTSSAPAVAEVNESTGVVTAKAIGAATITASVSHATDSSATKKSASYQVIVKDTSAVENTYELDLTTVAGATKSGTWDFGEFSVTSGKFHGSTYGWVWAAEGTVTFHVNGASTITLYNSYTNGAGEATVSASAGTVTSSFTTTKGDYKSSPVKFELEYSGEAADITVKFAGETYLSKISIADASYSSTISANALFDFRTMFASLPTSGSSASGSIKADGGEIAYSAMYYKDTTHGAYMYKKSTITFTVSGACTIYLGKDAYNGATYTIAAVDAESADLSSSLSATTVDAGIQNTASAATLASDATDLTADGAAAVSFNYTGTKAATITLSVTGAATTNYLPAMQVVFGE
ncbi:MAG: Ig-like domain-containing protein [Treponema sp.]|nr:Ig-like domain-containing protein [Treponema sp.]